MSDVLDVIRERVLCRFPILFLSTWEEERWESELASLALDIDRGLVTWTATGGAMPPLNELVAEGGRAASNSNGKAASDAEEFLAQIRDYPRDHVFLLKTFICG